MLQASGQGPGSSPMPHRATEVIDISAKVASAGEPAAPSVVMCKGFDTVLFPKPKPHNSGTSPPLVVPIRSTEPDSQAYQQLLHSRALYEAQHACATYSKHQLLPYRASHQTKHRATTDDQIMNHVRANPNMSMNQSRKLLRCGRERIKAAREKLKGSLINELIIHSQSSNPTATIRTSKEPLRVGIPRFRNVFASASVTGSPSAPRSCPKLQPPHGPSVPQYWNPPSTSTPLQHQQRQYFHPSQQMDMRTNHTSLAHTGSAASRYPMAVITGRDASLGPRIQPSHNGFRNQQVPTGAVLLGHSTPTNASRLPSQTNGIMTSNSNSSEGPVVALKIPIPPVHARVTPDTPHLPRPTADPQAHDTHGVDNHIHVRSKVRKGQSLAKVVCIDGQKYRTASEVVRCRHTKLANQMLELDAGFPMHSTATFKELQHSLRAWTTSRCPSKKSPGDHVDGGWAVVIHHTDKPSKTKGGRRRLFCDWHKEPRTKDSDAGTVMDALALC